MKPYKPHITNNNCTLTDPKHLVEQAKKIKRDKIKFKHPDKMYILLDDDVFIKKQYDKNEFIRLCSREGIIPLFRRQRYNELENHSKFL